MDRLIKMSFNTLLISGFNILSWFILGIIFDETISLIFTITYPIQSVAIILKCIFGTGANITKYKEQKMKTDNAGITIGIIVGLLIFITILLNINNYLNFMNVTNINYDLKSFTIFSICQIFLQYILLLLLEKLYFQKQNRKANIYVVIFNGIQLIALLLLSIIFMNPIITIIGTLILSSIFIIYCMTQTLKIEFKEIHILKYIKYDSSTIFSNILFLITYLIGLSNSFYFGEKYILAISFFTLITDMQWDISYNVDTLAKIDISQNNFNYALHKKNAIKLSMVLNISIVIMFILLYPYYKPNIIITLIFTVPTIIDLFIVPFYNLKKDYLHINFSPFKITIITQIANILRTLCSFIPTPYCTLLGQEVTIYLQLICFNIIFKDKYFINKNGVIENKNKEV